MVKQEILDSLSKDNLNKELNSLLDRTSKWLEYKNSGVLEKRNLDTKILHYFPDETFQCNVYAMSRLDWFGCINKQYFELLPVTTNTDTFTSKSVEAWQGTRMLELRNQGIQTFIVIYFKQYNKVVAITMADIKTLIAKSKSNVFAGQDVLDIGKLIPIDDNDALDLNVLFR